MRYINCKQYIILIFVIVIIILFSNSVLSLGSTNEQGTNTGETAQALQDQIDSNPTSVPTEDLAKFPEVANKPDNWDRLSKTQKDYLHKNHFSKFKERFMDDWKKRGVNLKNLPDDSQYDPDTEKIKFQDGTEIYLDTMKGYSIEPVDGGVLIDENKYKNAKEVNGSNDGDGYINKSFTANLV